jgi:hypothetical protein
MLSLKLSSIATTKLLLARCLLRYGLVRLFRVLTVLSRFCRSGNMGAERSKTETGSSISGF